MAAVSAGRRRRDGRRLALSLPCLPRRFSVGPQFLELPLVAQRIHRLPKSSVLIRHQFALARQSFQWSTFPTGRVALNIIEYRRFAHEKAAVDPADLVVGLFPEALHIAAVRKLEHPEPPGHRHRGHGRLAAMLAMETHDLADIEPRDAVAVGQAECLVGDVGRDPLDAAAGEGFEAGVDQRNLPLLARLAEELDAVAVEIYQDCIILRERGYEIGLD